MLHWRTDADTNTQIWEIYIQTLKNKFSMKCLWTNAQTNKQITKTYVHGSDKSLKNQLQVYILQTTLLKHIFGLC